jgi:hypothetical protein
VDRVPDGVEKRKLVGEQFHDRHEAGGEEHQRMRQQRQVLRKLPVSQRGSQAEEEDDEVEAHACAPGQRTREREFRYVLHELARCRIHSLVLGRDRAWFAPA